MTAKKLYGITVSELVKKIRNHKGLNQFVIERSKFEDWLKVELIDTLINNNIIAYPEISRIDVSFQNTAIELKTINTNYQYKNVKNKTRPITENVSGILKDISDLKKKEIKNMFVVFIVFPVESNNSYWQYHLKKIKAELSELVFKDFHFKNDVPGVIYYGKI